MKILVIGYGSIGKRHVKNLLKISGVEVIICTKRKNLELKIKNKCKIFVTVEKSLKENPDAAIITNTTTKHVSTALKLAKLGIHLLIEKPLSNNLKNIKKLSQIVKEKRIITLIGCNMRFHPCIQQIKCVIENKELGKIISIHSENGSYLPDWHPNENYQNSYASKKELGGGVILTCIHEIDYLYWFFGKVKEVFSITGKFSDLEINAEDLASIIIKFKNNSVAEVHLDYFQKPNHRSCKIIGTKGSLIWDSNSNTVKIYKIKTKKWLNKIKIENYDENLMYVDELNHFLKCIQEHKETINPLKQGIETLEIAVWLKKASKSKKMEKVI